MNSPAYPKYKKSGIEWLGDIPDHWEITPANSRLQLISAPVSQEWLAGKDVFHYSIPAVQRNRKLV